MLGQDKAITDEWTLFVKSLIPFVLAALSCLYWLCFKSYNWDIVTTRTSLLAFVLRSILTITHIPIVDIKSMETANQHDCFGAFGRSHRRKASVSSTATHYSKTGTPFSSTHGSLSSEATSIRTAATTPDLDPSAWIKAVQHNPGTALRALTVGGDDKHEENTPSSHHKRPTTLSNYLHQLNAPNGPRNVEKLLIATYTPRRIRHTHVPKVESCNGALEEPVLQLGSPELNGLRYFMHRTKNFLSSCCLIDIRTPSKSMIVSTDNRIARHVTQEVAQPKSKDDTPAFWCIQTALQSQGKRLFLILKRPVLSSVDGKHVFAMVACVDITGLLPSGFTEHIDDIWLNLAADEMRKALSERPQLLNHIPETNLLGTSSDLISSIQHISSFYDAFFIIELTASASGYSVSHTSSTSASPKQLQITRITGMVNAGEYKLARLLAQGYRFIFDARAALDDPHEIVWCLPLDGAGLKCWICFLLDGVA